MKREIICAIAASIINIGGAYSADLQQRPADSIIISNVFLRIEGASSSPLGVGLSDNGDGINTPCLALGSGCGGRLNRVGLGGSIGGGIGYRVTPWWSTDLTVTYRGGYTLNDTDQGQPNLSRFKGHIDSTSVMLGSRVYPLPSFNKITPYVEAGLGFSHNSLDRIKYVDNNFPVSSGMVSSATSNNFAWKVGAGFEIILTESISLSAGYRYFDGGNIRSGKQVIDNVVGSFDYPGMKGSLRSHEAVLTLSLGL